MSFPDGYPESPKVTMEPVWQADIRKRLERVEQLLELALGPNNPDERPLIHNRDVKRARFAIVKLHHKPVLTFTLENEDDPVQNQYYTAVIGTLAELFPEGLTVRVEEAQHGPEQSGSEI